jgi:putative SOS response-associated peptidase YedK
MLPLIRTYNPDRIELARWGFWPEEWKRNRYSYPMINARLETAAEKPMFASSFLGRHCLILANGYYEWRQIGKHKQPYRIALKTGEPFAMAGIYAREPTEFDTAEKNPVNFAILTNKANEAISYIHDRMPVILPLGREKSWLPPNPTGMFMFPHIPAELLTTYPVAPKMNRASFNEPAAIRPAGAFHDVTMKFLFLFPLLSALFSPITQIASTTHARTTPRHHRPTGFKRK